MNKIVAFLTLITLPLCASAQSLRFVSVKDLADYETVVKIARDKELMLLVALHDQAQGFQSMFQNGVMDDPAVRLQAKAYSLMAIEVNSEMGSRWVELFPPSGLPSFYVLNQDEFLLAEKKGPLDAKELAAILKKGREERQTYDSLLPLYRQQALSDVQWQKLIHLHSLNFPFEATARLAWDYLYLQGKEAWLRPQSAQWIDRYGLDLETPFPPYLIEHRAAFDSVLTDFVYEDYFERAFAYNLDLAIINEDSVLLKELNTVLIAAAPQVENKATLTLSSHRLYAQETGNFSIWKKGALAAVQQKTAQEASEMLFDEAFKLADEYEDSLALRSSYQLAQAANRYQENYLNHMLAAYTAYVLEIFTEGLEHASQALSMASTEGEKKKAMNLKNMIEGSMASTKTE